MRRKSIQTCVDRQVPADLRIDAELAAIEERRDNRPFIDTRLLPRGADMSRIAALTGKLWKPGRTLRVRFLDGDPAIQQKLQPYAHIWSKHANLTFVFGNDSDAEIRISFKQAGSWSYIGTDALAIPKNQPTMNYGWLRPTTTDDEYSRVVTHEFGHAIGLIHEHQNPVASIPWNKEGVYNYYKGPPNNWTRQQVDTNLFTRYAAEQTQFSQFDKQSIMLYPISKEFVTDPTYEVGWNKFLSTTDQSFVGTLYPQASKPTTLLTVGAAPLSASIRTAGEVDSYQFTIVNPAKYRIETTGNIDTVLELFGPNDANKLLVQQNTGGWWLNARIERPLAAGNYSLRIRHFHVSKTGNYKITVKNV